MSHNWELISVFGANIWCCSICGGCDSRDARPNWQAKINAYGQVYHAKYASDIIRERYKTMYSCDEWSVYGVLLA